MSAPLLETAKLWFGVAISLAHFIFWCWLMYVWVYWLNTANPYLLANWGIGLFLLHVAAMFWSHYLLWSGIEWVVSKCKRTTVP